MLRAGHESGEDSVEVYREEAAAGVLLYRSLPGSTPGMSFSGILAGSDEDLAS